VVTSAGDVLAYVCMFKSCARPLASASSDGESAGAVTRGQLSSPYQVARAIRSGEPLLQAPC
jgi:hypothetical protein